MYYLEMGSINYAASLFYRKWVDDHSPQNAEKVMSLRFINQEHNSPLVLLLVRRLETIKNKLVNQTASDLLLGI